MLAAAERGQRREAGRVGERVRTISDLEALGRRPTLREFMVVVVLGPVGVPYFVFLVLVVGFALGVYGCVAS